MSELICRLRPGLKSYTKAISQLGAFGPTTRLFALQPSICDALLIVMYDRSSGAAGDLIMLKLYYLSLSLHNSYLRIGRKSILVLAGVRETE